MTIPYFDPMRLFWDIVTAAIQGGAGQVTAVVTSFLFSTTDVLGPGGPFTGGAVIAHFQPSAVAVADAALAATVAWGSYHIMFGHGIRTLYSVRILLPRLLLAVVLANFSLPLIQAAIDVNNALCSAVLAIGLKIDPSSFVVGALSVGYGVLGVAYALRYSLLIVLAITAPLAGLLFVLPDTHHYDPQMGIALRLDPPDAAAAAVDPPGGPPARSRLAILEPGPPPLRTGDPAARLQSARSPARDVHGRHPCDLNC